MPTYRLGRIITVCPSCGRRRFKPYVDAAGRVLHSTVGRCNRQNSCGYHLTPRQYMSQRPNYRGGLSTRPSSEVATPPPADCMDPDWPRRSIDHSLHLNTLRHWLERRFGAEATARACALYGMGGSRLLGGSTIFWLRDRRQRVRSAKIMAYGPDGHRRRDHGPGALYLHAVEGAVRRGFRFRACYFGAHLIDAYTRRVLIVESEKTAIYLHLMLEARGASVPANVVIATGGKSALAVDPCLAHTPDYRVRDLADCHVKLIPDADAVDEWRAAIPTLRPHCSSVSLLDISPLAATPHDDILDILERRASQ